MIYLHTPLATIKKYVEYYIKIIRIYSCIYLFIKYYLATPNLESLYIPRTHYPFLSRPPLPLHATKVMLISLSRTLAGIYRAYVRHPMCICSWMNMVCLGAHWRSVWRISCILGCILLYLLRVVNSVCFEQQWFLLSCNFLCQCWLFTEVYGTLDWAWILEQPLKYYLQD